MATTIKTNNSYYDLKKALRKVDLPDKPRVLDCYAGNHRLWDGVELERYYPIDKQLYENLSITADNIKIMSSLDLSEFNVIDLDAYGIPTKQLEIIFESKFKGIVYFTFIQSMFGALPNKLLIEYGFTLKMLGRTRSLFNKNGFAKFKNFLAKRGVKHIKYFNPRKTSKFYGVFRVE